MAAAKETSNTAMAAVLSELEGIFTLKEQQRASLKTFLVLLCSGWLWQDFR